MSFVEVYNERIYDLLSRCAQCGGLVDDYHATGKSSSSSCGHVLCYGCSSQVPWAAATPTRALQALFPPAAAAPCGAVAARARRG